MSPRKKVASKTTTVKASGGVKQIEDKLEVASLVYDDTIGVLEKEGETLKRGEVYQNFKNKKYDVDVDDQDELRVFKNIRKSGMFKVASQDVVFHTPIQYLGY